jgi:hypothetical protein
MVLWPPLLQRELDKFRRFANNCRLRKQPTKELPSGVTPDFAYTFPEQFGGQDHLLPVDLQVIDEIIADLEEEKNANMGWGVPVDFAASVKAALGTLDIREKDITLQNVWWIFSAVLRLL